MLPPTKNIASRFHKYADTNGFSIEWCLQYADNVNREKASKRLHTSPATEIEYAIDSEYESRIFSAGDLTELTYIMKF